MGHFSLIGERKKGASPPFFPALSQYCGYANYSRTGSDNLYLAGEWYFDDSEEFLQAEKEMCQYLEEHGRVSTVELNISKRSRYSPKGFNATKYECETTSGYFLVYKNTFGREGDYFIVYYGAVGSVDLSNQTRPLSHWIRDCWAFKVVIQRGSLSRGVFHLHRKSRLFGFDRTIPIGFINYV